MDNMEDRYDGQRLRLPSWYWNEDPYYVPIELLQTNPELYWHLTAMYKKMRDEAWDLIKPKLLSNLAITGKAIFLSTVEETKVIDWKDMWDNSDPVDPTFGGIIPAANNRGLRRFFKPFNQDHNEYGHPEQAEQD